MVLSSVHLHFLSESDCFGLPVSIEILMRYGCCKISDDLQYNSFVYNYSITLNVLHCLVFIDKDNFTHLDVFFALPSLPYKHFDRGVVCCFSVIIRAKRHK